MTRPHDAPAMTHGSQNHHALLVRVARQALKDRGLQPDFSPAVMAEVARLAPLPAVDPQRRDVTALPWCSIDNDDSLDLDQLTVAEPLPDGAARISIAIADVGERVPAGSAIDDHASANTTSIYTPAQIFPMLPERLSTDLTSLMPDGPRNAVVIEVLVRADGTTGASDFYLARVQNHAKLAYSHVGPWLENGAAPPPEIARVPGLADNLKLQDAVAQRLRGRRHEEGALDLETLEVRTQFEGQTVAGLVADRRNRARDLIEDFMIAGNGAIARFLEQRRFPVLRRVVRTPARWPRIVEIAAGLGETLPDEPDAKALNQFLLAQRARDLLHFPDLSLTVIKLLGNGEYVASFPGQEPIGHFGLAVREYTHSTAPNRRYPDLITQRMVKAAIAGAQVPYAPDQLGALAHQCTTKEDDVQKVERLMRKAAAACLLSDRIGTVFPGVVTGASEKGTWVRVLDPPVEGRVEQNAAGLDVGDSVRVKLLRTDPWRGFIDFARVGPAKHTSAV